MKSKWNESDVFLYVYDTSAFISAQLRHTPAIRYSVDLTVSHLYREFFVFFFFFVGFCWCSILLLRTFMGISHDTHVMLSTERNEWNEYDSLSSLRTAIAGTVDATVVYARYEIYRFSWNEQKSVCVHCLLDICVRDLCTFDNSAIHLSEHFRRHQTRVI